VYIAEKAKHDEEKAEEEKRKRIEYGLSARSMAIKFRRKKG
jgi:hypothetical protein